MLKTKSAPKSVKKPAAAMTLKETMQTLEKAGSAQTRKTYLRHGAPEPMFGVSFATLKTLWKKIGVNHDLALALWKTKNFDARNLAYKLVDPAQMSPADLDEWAAEPNSRMCGAYIAHIAVEGPHAKAKADQWLGSSKENLRCAGWTLVSAMAMIDETTPDTWFSQRLAEIEKIKSAPNTQRYIMNNALIMIGCRNASLRKSALAVAKRIGKVEVDHGDTSCKTPGAIEYIEKTWAHSKSKGFETPAAHERARESMRTRC